jgi:hypothetical protein
MATSSNLPFLHKQIPAAPLKATESTISQEQMQVVQSTNRITLVQGGPSTGKTETLVQFAAARAGATGIVLVKNDAQRALMSDRLRAAGAHSFAAHTFRSLALAQITLHRPELLDHAQGAWSAWALMQTYQLSSSRHAGMAFGLLANFLCSDASMPSTSHLHPDDLFHSYAKAQAGEENAQRALQIATQSWADIVQGRAPMPQEAYLKVYLEEILGHDPRAALPQCDHLLIDDVHELDAAMLRLVTRFADADRSAVILALGDTYQRVGQFRCPVDPLDVLAEGASTYQLTRSFSLAQPVAEAACRVVAGLLDGHTRFSGEGTREPAASNFSLAVISRTIAPLLDIALEAKGEGIYWPGGDEAVQKLINVYQMSAGRRDLTNIAFFREFGDYATLSSYAQTTGEGETLGLIRLVETYGAKLPALAETMLGRLRDSATDPEVRMILLTAHEAAGQYFDCVRLAEDLTICADAAAQLAVGEDADEQEAHLLYVAITRARHELTLNAATLAWLKGKSGANRPVRAAVRDPINSLMF